METASPRKRDQIVSGLLEAIFHEWNRPMSREDIAQRLDYSPTHFRRVFAEEMGEPIGAFVRRMRLERSAGMLTMGEKNIAYLAWEAQYRSGEAFTSAAAIVTFIYEGPALLGKQLPSGEFNWVGNGLETIYRYDSGDASPWAVR